MIAHPFSFDPTHGYDRAALLKVPAAPEVADFAAFWQRTYDETRAIAPAVEKTPCAIPVPGCDVFEISFASWGGQRIRGWFAMPRNRPVRRALVISHGYGGREGPDNDPLFADAAVIWPCARGLSLSRMPGVPDQSMGHVRHGIASRETYIHRGCTADIWAAVSALGELAPEAMRRIDYIGTSFGGGIGALAVAWEPRFTRAFFEVPSFGQHPLRLTLPCVGSGESVRLYALKHPEVAGVLAYFDASVAAGYIRIPTLVATADFDPAVPPPGQFAVYNAIAAPKALLPLPYGHFDHPDVAAASRAVREAIIRFLQ